MSDYWQIAQVMLAFYAIVYATSFMAALGWKHGRGTPRVTNIHINAVRKEDTNA